MCGCVHWNVESLLQLASSEPSWQSIVRSQSHDNGTHSPLAFRHGNSSGLHTFASAITKAPQYGAGEKERDKNVKDNHNYRNYIIVGTDNANVYIQDHSIAP